MTKAYSRFLTALFCLFLGGLMVWQVLLPDRERSDVENRTLASGRSSPGDPSRTAATLPLWRSTSPTSSPCGTPGRD